MSNKLENYDSLENNPIVNTGLAGKIEEVLRGKEPVANGHGEPLEFDLLKDGRTEYGFYWEFEDIAAAAKEIANMVEDHQS